MAFRDWILGAFGRRPRLEEAAAPRRGPATHVVILDGTMSSLAPGRETNAGLTYKLLREVGWRANLSLYYEAGIQWRDWRSTLDVVAGRGLDRQIVRAYGVLASRFRPGDRIVLIGYSRGGYAVRSLAGVIGRVGLLRRDRATVRGVRQAWRHYMRGGTSQAARAFSRIECHQGIEVEAVAVWDCVKSLGLRLPLLWRLTEAEHAFHDHSLGPHVRHGLHALALDETRRAYAPVMWVLPENWPPHRCAEVEQVWFRGSHGDIGGQLGEAQEARPLANIPLVWMLDRLEGIGLPLPSGWRRRFVQDITAPGCGTWGGWNLLFLSRGRRTVGADPSERLHESVVQEGWQPRPETGAGQTAAE
ncbi:DUF2235 domain-containing protein [Pseudoroseicyclus aestuarii]|uniref:Uncharacterized protein (DUF2235 family) n=1 Tax=Pseudoroseicyclus aestuarii TaxID=1795041 RepID=A0A318SVE1_9RHOB|nr:DUF2235 domain-containing protein [Pseudoroseicyclus aestuarii]PYE85462.1 uncharacterized protein (DUF2235 family) [Pseudoroseicyclus aestuarii]